MTIVQNALYPDPVDDDQTDLGLAITCVCALCSALFWISVLF